MKKNEENVNEKVHNTGAVDAESMEDMLAEFDRESNTRKFTGVPRYIVRYMLALFSIFALWLNIFGTLPEQICRASFLALIIFMAFMIYPVRKKGKKRTNYVPWYDFVFGIVGAAAFFYFVADFEGIVTRAGMLNTVDIVVALVGILALFEVCRRAVGLPIIFVVCGFLAYALLSGFSVKRVIGDLFYTTNGIIGTPLGVCASYIVLFVMFGAFLGETGVGKFFIDVANSIAGGATGGPAKVAVIASGLQGMISGSSVANTVGSGSFTIPMMKKTGYKPEFAAAVEAAASTGGQIMPPIMGAAAFLMAEIAGIPYSTIVIAAILPACLYFIGIFLMIHYEAKKLGLKGLAKEDIPHCGKLLLKKGYLLIPLVVLVGMMMTGSTPARAACFAILSSIIVSLFRKETRITPKGCVDALENGAKSTISVAIACAIAGIIVGVVTLTGLGLKLVSVLMTISGGIPLLVLFFTMIACIVIGMGVPTTATYVIMAIITAPILIQLGVDKMAAHMFVFYFGIVADITPPVALAAYAGAAIAGSDPFKTGVTATKLAITAFLIPYIFAMDPSMLLVGAGIGDIILIIISSLIGMVGISTGVEGFMFVKMPAWQRLMAIAGGLLLVIPGIWTDIAGVLMVAAVVVLQKLTQKKQTAQMI